jgi:hypothetical protein
MGGTSHPHSHTLSHSHAGQGQWAQGGEKWARGKGNGHRAKGNGHGAMEMNTGERAGGMPAPVRPTIPAREPAGMVTVSPFSTSGRPGLYRIFTPLNSTCTISVHMYHQTSGRPGLPCIFTPLNATCIISGRNVKSVPSSSHGGLAVPYFQPAEVHLYHRCTTCTISNSSASGRPVDSF